jgi:3D-(3,5/4)-trihydroxycyclohexane-1,2-dione acylhydrolase (decyclizing)
MRVLTNQAETGAVTLALPQDVQAEAFDYPAGLFEHRVWHVPRPLPESGALDRAARLVRGSRRPLIVAGGGTIYSEASAALSRLVVRTGIPMAETQAGKGSLAYDHPGAVGAIGSTGTFAANRLAAEADVVVGIGTRWTDFTTASKTAFPGEDVRFVNINVADFDAAKLGGLGLTGDARVTIEALDARLEGWAVDPAYRERTESLRADWDREVSRLYQLGRDPLPAQSEVIGAVNELSGPRDVVVCAAGSMPGDLHKLWRSRDPKQYHVEYGYSCMGYEIAGGLGVKMADPEREVYVMVGDGSYLMMAQEIATSVQERRKLIVVLVDNAGYKSIGALSRSKGTAGFGTRDLMREDDSVGDDATHAGSPPVPVDLALNAEGLGAHVIRARTIEQLRDALVGARAVERTVVVHIPVDRYESVPDYEGWWDVPVAEVSEMEAVREARLAYEADRRNEGWWL